MDQIPEFASLVEQAKAMAERGGLWLQDHIFITATLVQFAAILASFVVARLIAPVFARWLDGLIGRTGERLLQYLLHAVRRLAHSLVWLCLLGLAILVADQIGWPHQVMAVAVNLLTAWIVISFVSRAVSDPLWSRATWLPACWSGGSMCSRTSRRRCACSSASWSG